METDSDLLVTKDLKKYFQIRRSLNPFSRAERRYVKAVDGVSISIPRGKTVAVVGESGCGKTTLARTVAQLVAPTSGEVLFDGHNLQKMNHKEVYKNIQIVFQDPDSSLDPRRTIADTVGEPIHGLIGGEKSAIEDMVLKSLEAVGLSEEQAYRIPKQLSGGQRQRVAIAEGDRSLSEIVDSGRADECSGRLRAGADSQAPHRAAESIRPVLHAHHPQHFGGAVSL